MNHTVTGLRAEIDPVTRSIKWFLCSQDWLGRTHWNTAPDQVESQEAWHRMSERAWLDVARAHVRYHCEHFGESAG